MGRIKAFRFKWSDAWRDVSDGYDSILEIFEKGDVRLLFMVNSQPYEVDLTDKENEFISKLDFLKNWNKKTYIDELCLDGFNWEILFTYDNTAIYANGYNGYPPDFPDFLDILHNKFSVPKSNIEKCYKEGLKPAIKRTTVTYDPNLGKKAMYL